MCSGLLCPLVSSGQAISIYLHIHFFHLRDFIGKAGEAAGTRLGCPKYRGNGVLLKVRSESGDDFSEAGKGRRGSRGHGGGDLHTLQWWRLGKMADLRADGTAQLRRSALGTAPGVPVQRPRQDHSQRTNRLEHVSRREMRSLLYGSVSLHSRLGLRGSSVPAPPGTGAKTLAPGSRCCPSTT